MSEKELDGEGSDAGQTEEPIQDPASDDVVAHRHDDGGERSRHDDGGERSRHDDAG